MFTLFLAPLFVFQASGGMLKGDVETKQSKSTARLVMEYDGLPMSKPTGLGIAVRLEPHWHTYWKNSGDSGAAPIIDINVPEGIEVSEIKYPVPQRLVRKDFTTFGYENDVLLFREVTVKDKSLLGQTVPVKVEAEWLVCDEICIPQTYEFKTEVTVRGHMAESSDEPLFNSVRAAIPDHDGDWNASVVETENRINLSVKVPDAYRDAHILDFYPYRGSGIGNKQGIATRTDGIWKFELPKAETPKSSNDLGVLVIGANGGTKAIELRSAVANYSAVTTLVYAAVAFFVGLIVAKTYRRKTSKKGG